MTFHVDLNYSTYRTQVQLYVHVSSPPPDRETFKDPYIVPGVWQVLKDIWKINKCILDLISHKLDLSICGQ